MLLQRCVMFQTKEAGYQLDGFRALKLKMDRCHLDSENKDIFYSFPTTFQYTNSYFVKQFLKIDISMRKTNCL
ncbi:hypothetical protein NPIL_99541 [Nephila pilipes]|uniref:Uncharacterized protein n=1 Tax=Nephila pilipes TaxID=299642 RepID=A0A8X6P2V6_NEPPI|nr:hypothetical protein NPIL_99541 [Nephila pilipes]